MSSLEEVLINAVLAEAPIGVVIIDAIDPSGRVVYANLAYQELAGYAAEELVGRPFRISQLQGESGGNELQLALERKQPTEAVVRDVRIDGSVFWNHVTLRPLKDAEDRVTHFAVFCRDVGQSIEAKKELATQREKLRRIRLDLEQLARTDKVTGVRTRRYFEDMLRRDWAVAQREGRTVSIMLFDIDFFHEYRETFGPNATDSCLRLVARAIAAALRRASDLVGRYQGGRFASLVIGLETDEVTRLARAIGAKVEQLCIHHPKSEVSRYVTVSTGVASVLPPRDMLAESLFAAAEQALEQAQSAGRNTVAKIACG